MADIPDLSQPPVAISRYLTSDAWHFFDSRWQKAFGANAASQMTESLCLLYVAMTRARQALYMITQPSKREDKKASSLIRAALCPESFGATDAGIVFEDGDPQWYA